MKNKTHQQILSVFNIYVRKKNKKIRPAQCQVFLCRPDGILRGSYFTIRIAERGPDSVVAHTT